MQGPGLLTSEFVSDSTVFCGSLRGSCPISYAHSIATAPLLARWFVPPPAKRGFVTTPLLVHRKQVLELKRRSQNEKGSL